MLIDHNGDTIADVWTIDQGDESVTGMRLLVSFPAEAERAEEILAGNAELGLAMRAEDALEAPLPDLQRVSLITLEFPKFADGRAYSVARLLRIRHGYEGELRATGDVLPDQVGLMLRCGFDSFELSRARNPEIIQTALSELRHVYQSSADERRPIWELRRESREMATTDSVRRAS